MSPLRPLRRAVASGLVAFAVLGLAAPAQAQTAATIVQEMKNRYLDQFDDVDTYVVETDLYTSYHEKIAGGEIPEFRTATRMKGQGQALTGMGSAAQGQFDQFDSIAEHGEYRGTEMIGGSPCYVLHVNDPSKIDASMGESARSLTYYVGAADYLPRRMEFVMATQQQGPPQKVTVNLTDYRTVDGLTLPWRMEVRTNFNETMSPQQKQRLEEMKRQMDQMDDKQREMMKSMMGDRMKQLERMMSGEPTVITVSDVTVNQPLPDGVFQ